LLAVAGIFWWPAFIGLAVMLALSLGVAALQAAQAVLPPAHDGIRSRLLVMGLSYAQPLVRSWHRYKTRLFSYRRPTPSPQVQKTMAGRLPLTGRRTDAYWGEKGYDRTELLGLFVAFLIEHRWGTSVDSGWSDWDVEVHYHPWTLMQVFTVQENHGGDKRLIRVRYRVRPTALTKLVTGLGLAITAVLTGLNLWCALASLAALAVLLAGTWCRGIFLASRAVEAFDNLAGKLEQTRIRADHFGNGSQVAASDNTIRVSGGNSDG
jgi:hypothetical protein